MRTTIAVATFLAVGAGAVGVSALDMKGSDTLEVLTKIVTGQDNPTVPAGSSPSYTIDSPAWHDFTSGLSLDCGGVAQGTPAASGGIVYVGTGSGAGEGALVSGPQVVAPMSRALAGAAGSGVCLATAALQQTAESMAFALDGLSIVANTANWGTVVCNGAAQDCDNVGTDPDAGIAFKNTKVISAPGYVCPAGGVDSGCVDGSYRIFDFKDALRLIYAGMDHDASNNRALRNCSSAPRAALAASWGNVFQSSGCTSGSCTAIQHAFRRNASSGTTDVFGASLGLPSITLTGASATEPYCNAVASTDVLTGPLPAAPIALGDPANATPPATPATIFFTDFQDRDVIRRVCAGTFSTAFEQVCSARGDLGLVLPIWDAPVAVAPNTPFPSAACSAGKFVNVKGPNAGLTFGPCPNGKPQVGGTCVHPAQADGNPVCLNSPGNFFVAQGRVDGRVYNLHLHDANKNYITAVRGTGTTAGTANVQMVGGYYRIHTTRGIPTGSAGCTRESATTQIGCLVGTPSPCSMGYAGREASLEVGAVALKVGGIDPTPECVRNLLPGSIGAKYPLSRKLYLNTVKGYGNNAIPASSPERKLAACMSNRTIVDQATIRAGFITFDDSGTLPTLCEDFNEFTACGTGTANVNACADTVLPVPVTGP